MSFPTSTKVSGPTGNHWTTNFSTVWGQMTTGGGLNLLQKSMSILGVPVMSKWSFIQTEQRVVGCPSGINESCRKGRKATCR